MSINKLICDEIEIKQEKIEEPTAIIVEPEIETIGNFPIKSEIEIKEEEIEG
jgi:hypothetical protein